MSDRRANGPARTPRTSGFVRSGPGGLAFGIGNGRRARWAARGSGCAAAGWAVNGRQQGVGPRRRSGFGRRQEATA